MFEPGKEYKTRDGRKARVYAVDGQHPYCVHGAYMAEDGWASGTWLANGSFANYLVSSEDLMPPPGSEIDRAALIAEANELISGAGDIFSRVPFVEMIRRLADALESK